jgi:hypothetical protein
MSASANMIMRGDDDHSNNPIAVAVDAETLVAQTQERLSRALKRHYQYESNLKPGQEFLLNHINSKISLVIIDLLRNYERKYLYDTKLWLAYFLK